MRICSFSIGPERRRLLLRSAVLAGMAFATAAYAQDPFVSLLAAASNSTKSKEQPRRSPEKDAGKPSIVIPVTPLGFATPASFYLGERRAQASLDFLDENTLLFTFRVPGLISREAAPADESSHDQRHIRAVTLELPSGKVLAESLWVLHDYNRYLWALKDGKFLLRDKNLLQTGDASLHLEPYLRFPGPVLSVEFDPNQDWLVTDTAEPPAKPGASDSNADAHHGGASNALIASAAAGGSVSIDGNPDPDLESAHSAPENLIRVLNMRTPKVMFFSRARTAIHLPIDGEGYYEALRGDGIGWMINFEYFHGASRPLGWVESTCTPALDVLAPGVVLASACMASGGRHLTVLSRDRDKDHAHLWDLSLSPTRIWPLLKVSANGERIARAALEVTHPVGVFSPLDNDDIRGQIVQVFDVATGRTALTVPASPVLDGGGNFALSPSGNRFAVLSAGAIQVYDLPPAPSMEPAPAANASPTVQAKPARP